MLTMIAKLLAALNSESSPGQIALAIALGMVLGFTPILSIHNIAILLLAFVIKVNFSAFILSAGFFAGFALALSGLFANIGASLLTDLALNPFWTGLYQLTWFKLAHLHHTLTLGSLLVSLLLFIPVHFTARWLIVSYRHHIRTFIEKFKIVQALKSSRLYQMYQSYSQ